MSVDRVPDMGNATRRARRRGFDVKVRFNDNVTVELDGEKTKAPGICATVGLYRKGKRVDEVLIVDVPEREMQDESALSARLDGWVRYLLNRVSR